MDISLAGINFQSAPIDIRERFHLAKKRIAEIYSSPQTAKSLVILATCNRTEFYCASEQPLPPETILKDLARIYPENRMETDYLYFCRGIEVVKHLLGLASGLQSMILGETEILGQIAAASKEATQWGQELGVLGEVFPIVISHARRIRIDSRIGNYSLSLTSLVTKKIEDYCDNLVGGRVLILGNGEIAQKIAKAVLYHGFITTILTRCKKSPVQIQPTIQYRFDWENLEEVLAENDIIITATAAPHLVVKKITFLGLRGNYSLICRFHGMLIPI